MPETPRNALDLIAVERRRQVGEEGWTPEHDDAHIRGELRAAAMCYLTPSRERADESEIMEMSAHPGMALVPRRWPWEAKAWKPARGVDDLRDLVKAGALIVAEIERLQRASKVSDA